MRRAMTLLFLVIVFLIPTQAAFAQDGDMPFGCDFETVLNDFSAMLMESADPDAAAQAFEYLLDRVVECAEPWLNAFFVEVIEPLLSDLMGGMGGIDIPPDLLLAPDDGVLTSDEAEYAINQVFGGDLAEANQFICESEQVEDTEAPPLSYINEISCQEDDGAMNCYIDAVVGGESFTET